MHFASDYVLAESCTKKLPNTDDREPDTNVVSVKFTQLIEAFESHAGDPIECTNCEAILSKLSVVSETNQLDGKRVWKCDFCHFENRIFLALDEIPRSEEVTYMIEPPAVKVNDISNANGAEYLIYCIDVSGSMSVTTKIENHKPEPSQCRKKLPFLPISPVNSKPRYISRLDVSLFLS